MKTITAVLLALLLAFPVSGAERYELDTNTIKGGLVFTGAMIAAGGATLLHKSRMARQAAHYHAAWSTDAYRVAAVSTGAEATAWADYGAHLARSSAANKRRAGKYKTYAAVVFGLALLPVAGGVLYVGPTSEGYEVRKVWRF